MERFFFRSEPQLLARLAKFSLEKGFTQSEVARRALTEYLSTNSEEGGIELAKMKRQREIEKGRPLDLHDGVMLAARVREIVKKQKETIKTWRGLEADDYDHFIIQVQSERKLAETYEHKEWILKELSRLEQELLKEKEACTGG